MNASRKCRDCIAKDAQLCYNPVCAMNSMERSASMAVRTPLGQSRRLAAALVALCYLCISTIVSFQHTELLTHNAEFLLQTADAGISSRTHAPLRTAVHQGALPTRCVDCLACEWQAANTSVAVPVFAFTFALPSQTAVITAFPRYLSAEPISASSRAPPAV